MICFRSSVLFSNFAIPKPYLVVHNLYKNRYIAGIRVSSLNVFSYSLKKEEIETLY